MAPLLILRDVFGNPIRSFRADLGRGNAIAVPLTSDDRKRDPGRCDFDPSCDSVIVVLLAELPNLGSKRLRQFQTNYHELKILGHSYCRRRYSGGSRFVHLRDQRFS